MSSILVENKLLYYINIFKVRAFDPTVKGPPEDFVIPDGLSFTQLGISNETSSAPLLQSIGSDKEFEVDSLDEIIRRYKTIYCYSDFTFGRGKFHNKYKISLSF